MFLREWEGYERVYSYIKEKLSAFSFVKAILYLFVLVFCFFNHSAVLSLLRVIVFSILLFLEYFLGCIFKEKNDRTTSISCYFLMIMAAINVTCYFIDFLTRI